MLHGPNAAGELQTFSFENSVDLGRVLSKSRTLTLGDFGATLGGHSGQRSARLLESSFPPASARLELNVFEPGPDDPRVVLDLEAGGRWVVEQYPTETLEELDGGRCRVRMAVTGEAWLQRLLLRLGPDCRVSAVDGPGDLGDAGSRAACRLLARYATEGPVRS